MSDYEQYYRVYSNYLKNKYGEKVYKLPVNIPCTCPNRDGTKSTEGCIFCGASGSGYELLDFRKPVLEQLEENKQFIQKKYKAKKFIAYFQSFSNTYLPFDQFSKYIKEALQLPDLVEIAISTRPDCVSEEILEFLERVQEENQIDITIELGLQSSNDSTLKILNRQHNIQDYIDAARRIKKHHLQLAVHVISDLPWDTTEDIIQLAQLINTTDVDFLKIHSLYVEKGTKLEELYKDGLQLLSEDDYIQRTILLLERISPEIVIERLIGRVPEESSVVANWHKSWWKVRDKLIETMMEDSTYQGRYITESGQRKNS